MAFKSIMVCVDLDEQSEVRIGVAAALAYRFNAVLIGVAGWPLRKSGSLAHSDTEFPPTEEYLQAKVAEELERLGEIFRRCARSAPRSISASLPMLLARPSRSAAAEHKSRSSCAVR